MERAGGKLLLLDGHSMAYRAFYALPAENFTISTGQSTNAIYGFTSMLINVVRDEAPTHLAVAFDVSRSTLKRTALFPAYKAQRAATPPEFVGQVELLSELLGALHVPVFRKEGSEADDLIATLATQAAAEGFDVAIVTGDRDALQLVTDHVTVLYPRKGVADLVRYTPEAVEEKYELTPRQYPDFAALRGDPSDNLPSIPGVGEKTAAKWIREFGSLDALVERADEVKGKAGENLRAHLEQVKTNRMLTELDREVELDRGPADLGRTPGDTAAVDQLFDTLQFRALRSRIGEVFGLDADAPAAHTATSDEPDLHTSVLTTGQLAPWLAEHAQGPDPVGIAVEGRWGRGTGELSAVALATTDGHAAHFDRRRPGPVPLAVGPRPPQDPARRQGPHPRAVRPRLRARGPSRRHRPGRLPGPARPTHRRASRPGAPIPGPRTHNRPTRRPTNPGCARRRRRRRRPTSPDAQRLRPPGTLRQAGVRARHSLRI
jgi:DNA polymerase-1